MRPYLDLCARILSEGEARPDRTGTGTIAIFGHQMRFDLADGFPLVTTKKLHWKSIVYELLWFLKGDTNVAYLNAHNVRIWDEWADENGDLGPVYGRQWRAWPAPDGQHIDQIENLVAQIKRDPTSRRQIVSAWNVAELPGMALVPCHCLWHTAVLHGRLHMQLYQRSGDVFLGVPFNIASYALLLAMLAQQCDLEPGEFIWTGGDCHIYANHVDQVRLQMTRAPYPLPKLMFKRKPASIFDYAFEDFELLDYQAHPHIKGMVAV